MILQNLVFLSYLPIYRQKVFSTVSQIEYITFIVMRSLDLALKKIGNCNIEVT